MTHVCEERITKTWKGTNLQKRVKNTVLSLVEKLEPTCIYASKFSHMQYTLTLVNDWHRKGGKFKTTHQNLKFTSNNMVIGEGIDKDENTYNSAVASLRDFNKYVCFENSCISSKFIFTLLFYKKQNILTFTNTSHIILWFARPPIKGVICKVFSAKSIIRHDKIPNLINLQKHCWWNECKSLVTTFIPIKTLVLT
jgi:hypothetical protein